MAAGGVVVAEMPTALGIVRARPPWPSSTPT
jgi:hypothetical protein